MKQLYTLIFLCLVMLTTANAQDLMYLKNNKNPIKVKVYEIGLDEVKYRPWGDTIIPILVLPRVNITKLVLANGSVFEFKDNPMMDASNYADQHNNALKIHFLSPLANKLVFAYERSVKPGQSFEVGLGIIGAGVSTSETSPRGMFMRAGYKFITSPDFYIRGMRYAHILKGGYVKPELVYGGYGRDISYYTGYSNIYPYSSYYSTYRRSVTFGAVLVNFGKQWIINDAFLIDLYFGLGYGFESYSSTPNTTRSYVDDYDIEPYKYAYFGGMKGFPLAITSGFKIGFLFGNQKPVTEAKP
jgi:hypothetical protein